MRHDFRYGLATALVTGALLVAAPSGTMMIAFAQSSTDAPVSPKPAADAAKPAPDPRTGDPSYERARRLLGSIDKILEDTARNRSDARKLPSRDDFLVTPLWSETKEDREEHIRTLLDSALEIVTDVPIVDMQKTIEGRRKTIQELHTNITRLREKQLTAPTDSLLPGILTDTVDSLSEEIVDLEKRITGNKDEIAKAKTEIQSALSASGITMSPGQLDLLLDSVLSGDLVRLVATFNAAKVIDEQLGQIVQSTGDNSQAARKYFAMHAALFAMLVHAQDSLIKKIDNKYMPRLHAIEKDIDRAGKDTRRLLNGKNRDDQKRALEANLRSQGFANGEGTAEGDPGSSNCGQYLRDSGGEFPAPRADQGRNVLVRSHPEARGTRLRPDFQGSGTAARVRESDAKTGCANELRRREAMPNYIIAYHGGAKPETPEEGTKHMARWKAWVDGLDDAVVNPGTPLGKSRIVSTDGVSNDGGPNPMSGFSVVNADSINAAIEMAKACPFLDTGGTLEVAEMKEM